MVGFQITDDQPTIEQVHIYENLCVDVLNENMKMCEILQVNVLIEKLPPSWSDYRNHLKHKKNYLTLQELISHMGTEKANHMKDMMESLCLNSYQANLVEFAMSTNRDRFKGKGNKNLKPNYPEQHNKFSNKIQKLKGLCYLCGKLGNKQYQSLFCKG